MVAKNETIDWDNLHVKDFAKYMPDIDWKRVDKPEILYISSKVDIIK